jgi:predicted dehydrogenase
MLRVGIIGAGIVVRNAHALAFAGRDDVEVAAVADPDEASRAAVGASLACSSLYDDYRRILDRKDIQAVDVCLPHCLHEPVVVDALNAGKHVILEKPIALTLGEADRMIATAGRAKRQFYVALNQRFFPPHRKIKEMIDSGTYGRPFLAMINVSGDEFARMNAAECWKGDWERAGGGALADTGTHIIDLSLWWFGRPRTISCQWGRFLVEAENKADDTVIVTLGYDHMLVNIMVTYVARSDSWTEGKEIHFPDACLHVRMEGEHTLLLGANKKPPTPVAVDPMTPWWSRSVAAGVSHFLDCIMGKAQPEYGPEAARETLRSILLAYQAAKEQRTLMVPS